MLLALDWLWGGCFLSTGKWSSNSKLWFPIVMTIWFLLVRFMYIFLMHTNVHRCNSKACVANENFIDIGAAAAIGACNILCWYFWWSLQYNSIFWSVNLFLERIWVSFHGLKRSLLFSIFQFWVLITRKSSWDCWSHPTGKSRIMGLDHIRWNW